MTEQNESLESGQSVSKELRNVRYCEVIPVTRKGRTLTAWVYNTLGLNDCPAAEWDALTEDEINEEYGSVAAKLNGPRYWVLDKLVGSGSTTTGEKFTFGGIEMELRAKLETKLREGTVGEEFYVPNQVQRDTVYLYKAGKPVYELTSPEGDVYTMQSYAQIKDKNLTIDDLASLESKLALPEGWTYTTRTLTEDFELNSGGLAYVVNDDLYNSYQRRT
ncbi:MAG TPA: hypothetical protein VM911_19350 [Pyrinomonadaceae bacterium]|nr:hypothetical protein [Pyrinomonadaceae bacterium]